MSLKGQLVTLKTLKGVVPLSSDGTTKIAQVPIVSLPSNQKSTGMPYVYTCSQCDFKTQIEGMFKQHVDSIHLGISTVGNNIFISPNSSSTMASSTNQATTSGPTQTLVLNNGQKETFLTPTLTITPTSAVKKEPKEPEDTFQCIRCNESFLDQKQLLLHNQRLHGKSEQKLQQKDTKTTSTTTLQKSLQIFPAQPQTAPPKVVVGYTLDHANVPVSSFPSFNKKVFKCSQCGYFTSRRDGLTQHYGSVHLKIKNYKCELCPYAASQKGTLNRHVRLRHRRNGMPGMTS